MYNPLGADDYEYIEFYNSGSSILDLAGYKLVKDSKGDGLDFTFGSETLQPGEYLVLAEKSEHFTLRYLTSGSPYYREGLRLVGQWGGGLSNKGEKLQLQDRAGNLIIKFSYGVEGDGWPVLASGMGSSLELQTPSGLPNDLAEREKFLENPKNWRASSEFHGNPGWVGEVPDRRVVINEVLANTDGEITDTIELYNATEAEVTLGGWFLSDSTTFDKFRIPAGTVIPPRGFVTFSEKQFNPNGEWNPDAGLVVERDFSLSGSKGDDVWLVEADEHGNALRVIDKVEFGPSRSGVSFGRWPDGAPGGFIPQKNLTLGEVNAEPWAGPVVISEIQYNPGDTEDANNLEFIEVYNSSQAEVSLEEWTISGGVGFTFPQGIKLPADGLLVLVGFDPEDAVTLKVFQDYYGLDSSIQLLGPWSGTLSNSGETFLLNRRDTTTEPLLDESGKPFHPLVIEDFVTYSDKGDWPGRADGEGPSLARINLTGWGGAARNWQASREFIGNPGIAGGAAKPHVLVNEVLANSGISRGNKIDKYVLHGGYAATREATPISNVSGYLQAMNENPFHFTLFHFSGPDVIGHASGWGSDAYKAALEAVDVDLGRIFNLVESNEALKGKTVIVLTSDHGGGGGNLFSHGLSNYPENFTIPFYTWGAGISTADLYSLNLASRTKPLAGSRPMFGVDSSSMPIRNGGLGNLALDLLKLPPIPGSWINHQQDFSLGDSAVVKYVIAISVDGLRPLDIQGLGVEKLPNLHRFREEGAWTDNARASIGLTLTLVNHTSMITGRGLEDVEGLGEGHGQLLNVFVGGTLHQNIGGRHMASVFDIVHDNGLRTALYTNKGKFDLFKNSYLDVDTGMHDAIELYNPTGSDVNLGGWYLSDSDKNLKKYRIPDGTILAAGGYLAFNDKDFNPGLGSNPTDFALSGSNGDEVWLTEADSGGNLVRLVDRIEFGPSLEGVTVGRGPDSNGPFRHLKESTLGWQNGGHKAGRLILNEVMHRPAGSEDLGFIEFYNSGGETLQLDAWKFSGVGEFAFPQGLKLGPRELLVVLRFDPFDPVNVNRKAAFESAYGVTIDGQFIGGYGGTLGWVSDELKIFRPGNPLPFHPDQHPFYLEDEINYLNDSLWPLPDTGESLNRSNPVGLGVDPGNWIAGVPSPGLLVDSLTYAEWAGANLEGIQDNGAEEDHDRDGFANILEFALGLNPRTSSAAMAPVALDRDFNGMVEMTYQLNREAAGLQVRIQYTRDLKLGWNEISDADFFTQDEIVGLDGTVETRQLLVPADEEIIFLRMFLEN